MKKTSDANLYSYPYNSWAKMSQTQECLLFLNLASNVCLVFELKSDSFSQHTLLFILSFSVSHNGIFEVL